VRVVIAAGRETNKWWCWQKCLVMHLSVNIYKLSVQWRRNKCESGGTRPTQSAGIFCGASPLFGSTLSTISRALAWWPVQFGQFLICCSFCIRAQPFVQMGTRAQLSVYSWSSKTGASQTAMTCHTAVSDSRWRLFAGSGCTVQSELLKTTSTAL